MRPPSLTRLLPGAPHPLPRGPALAVRGLVLLLGAALATAATPSVGLISVAVAALWVGVVTPAAWCLARRRRPGRPVLGPFAVTVDILGVVLLLAVSGGSDSPVRWLLAATPLLCVYSAPRCLPVVIGIGAAGYGGVVLGELALGDGVQGRMVAGFFLLHLAVSVLAHRMRVLRSSESQLQRSLRRVRTDVVGEHLDKERHYAQDLVARLHDGPIQLVLCAAQDLGDHLEDEPVDLEASRGMLLEAVEEIRALNETRFQAVLDDAGLAAALRRTGQVAERRGGPPVTVNVGVGTGGSHDGTVIAAVGELLTNVAKHARADRASVVVVRDDEGLLRVAVEDDGVGIVAGGPTRPDRPGHTGLRFLIRHVEELGGTIRMSGFHTGTRTTILLPADAERPAVDPTAPPERVVRPVRRPLGAGAVAAVLARTRAGRRDERR